MVFGSIEASNQKKSKRHRQNNNKSLLSLEKRADNDIFTM
jgi:hypothetical protein